MAGLALVCHFGRVRQDPDESASYEVCRSQGGGRAKHARGVIRHVRVDVAWRPDVATQAPFWPASLASWTSWRKHFCTGSYELE